MVHENPLLSDWSQNPFGLPPFELIKPSHFKPAIQQSQHAHLEEIYKIVQNPEPATFDNTIKLYDRAGAQLEAIVAIFENLTGSLNVPELQQIGLDLAGPIADHIAKVKRVPGLFQRMITVYNNRETSDLSPQQTRLVERFYLDFVRAGALFDESTKEKYDSITRELAILTAQFDQNVMADESGTVSITLSELDGCPPEIIAATKQAATEKDLAGYAVSLKRSLVESFLSSCPNPEARERVFQAFVSRGELNGSVKNKEIAVRILKLRSQQAVIHGYPSFAAFATADCMAKTPKAVTELLERVWVPAKVAANRERDLLVEYAKSVGEGKTIRSSDWRYYSEKVRAAKFDVDENLLKPYFGLDRIVDALFDVAFQLYGLTFVHRPDLKTYHEDVLVYEVHEELDGQDVIRAIFLHDKFARSFKSDGAWMSVFRTQNRNIDDFGTNVIPIVINCTNFTKPSNDGEHTFLSFDDCVTLFHEFGHGLHGILSDSQYKRLASTRVLNDYSELPSQLMEHWIKHPQVLGKYARHFETNESIPANLLDKLMAARKFQQGFESVEYVACALMDQALHSLLADKLETLDVDKFEAEFLDGVDMPQGVAMRHRIPHFSHLFAEDGYAAGYYAYLWSEVLDSDAFNAFLEAGDIFDKTVAKKARQYIYSAGSTMDHMDGYRAFRGLDPAVEPMLVDKGFL
ncbi:UNVERIFIED_CONTAM: hypothetical protein HDU68_002101 [Siphonaria sp. JEL0065]|nr:hypothetical protein HDU68_002101 [Siphonaria sp. JEL0065]